MAAHIGRRNSVSVIDIARAGDLMRYATVAQVEWLQAIYGWSRRDVADRIGYKTSQLSRALKQGGATASDGPPLEVLHAIDDVLATLVKEPQSLVALRSRLDGGLAAGVRVPAGWLDGLVGIESDDAGLLLCQGAALLAALGPVNQHTWWPTNPEHLRHLQPLTERLLLLAMAPPVPGSSEAHQLVAQLAARQFDPVFDRVRHAIRSHPLGFRSWRSISAALRSTQTDGPTSGLRNLLLSANDLRAQSLFPARCLDIEALLYAGPDMRIDHVLEQRAANPAATGRERTLATLAIIDRLGLTPESRLTVERSIARLERDLKERGEDGLRWAISVLDGVRNDELTTFIPEDDNALVVTQATLAIPERAVAADRPQPFRLPGDSGDGGPSLLRDALCFLTRQALLQSHGVYRRNAIDTLRSSNTHLWALNAFNAVLADDRNPTWLRTRAAFAIGLCGANRDYEIEQTLLNVLHDTLGRLDAKSDLSNELTEAAHTTFFAIGDCYGHSPPPDGAQDLVSRALELDTDSPWPARGATYCAALTNNPDDQSRTNHDKRAREHRDPLVRATAAYGASRYNPEKANAWSLGSFIIE